jgi:hypothetical protein
MHEAFDQQRSVGWISQLRLQAGHRAGEELRQIDTGPLGPVVVLRDETFFQGDPILLVVDPVITTILFAQVCSVRQADTWGVTLLMAQERGAVSAGLVEDMARLYSMPSQNNWPTWSRLRSRKMLGACSAMAVESGCFWRRRLAERWAR